MMRFTFLVGLVLVALIIDGGVKAANDPRLTEKLLARYPQDVDCITFSSTGRKAAFRAFDSGKQFVVVNDSLGERFDEVKSIGFGESGENVCYLARTGDKWIAVVGTARHGQEFDNVENCALSADGKKVALEVKVGRRRHVVVSNGEKSIPDAHADWPIFSPDSQSFAYRAYRGDKWFFVLNGQPLAEYDEVAWPAFSPDSKAFGYLCRTGKDWAVVIGTRKHSINADAIEFLKLSPGGRTFAVKANQGANCFVQVGEKQGPRFKDVKGYTIGLSPDGNHVAYAARSDKAWHGVYDGKSGPPSDGVLSVAISSDGKNFAYSRREQEQSCAVVGEKVSPKYDFVERIVFEEQGKRLGFGVCQGREFFWKTMALD